MAAGGVRGHVAETFPLVYGLKYHTTTMDQLTTDWLGPRMYRPSLEEVLRGALRPDRPNNVPPGTSSIQVEVYFSDRYRPLTMAPETLIDDVINDLQRIGVLREDDRLLVKEARLVRYANVIYDHERAGALATVHDYLADIGIARCGRYGDWDHAWTDESFISGERAADEVLAAR